MMITVQIPALSEYVAYLREQDARQKAIDEATAQLNALLERLKKANANLTIQVERGK